MDDKDRIERLVEAAAQSEGVGARLELFRALNGVEMFYAATEVVVDGRTMLSTPLRRLDDGSSAMVVYTSRSHRDLPQKFAGAQWSTVLKLAHETMRSDWLVIVGRNNATVAVRRDQLLIISAELLEPEYRKAEPAPADELENAISSAVNDSSDNQYERALIQLRGQEVYLHLADAVSPEGQRSMRTSAAAGRDGWLLTYTTRKRPGINYGGIRWEELVKMIKKNEAIPGVRVVNDVDDWILLGRDVIR